MKTRANNKLNKRAILSGLRFYAMYGTKNPFNNQFSNDELNALKAQDLVDLLHGLLQYRHIIIYYGPLALQDAAATIHKVHPLPAAFVPYPKGNEFANTQCKQHAVK